MRLSTEKIKEAILHPEEEVRLTAVHYFSDSHSTDASIMPLVIQAVEKHGRDSSFRILRSAERLVQTSSTLDWVINQLRQTFDIESIEDDNLRFASALVVMAAPIDLVNKRKADIDALTSFPTEIRDPLDERLRMATWGFEQCWEALEELGRKTMKKGEYSQNDTRLAGRIIESLAQHPEERGDIVLGLLRKNYSGKDNRLIALSASRSLISVGFAATRRRRRARALFLTCSSRQVSSKRCRDALKKLRIVSET